ncbi:MAG: nucleotidyl transferase AbiEii/AbiGii toxin family protein [Bacteroidetes bacterium]|nr:nucleotidyl transferase AbiEii/AbiGii toxin family protein [Bacteroidota bacterium]
MLSLDNIKSYYSENLWGFERFILREYLQYKILEIIYDGPHASKLVFMGGTALRIVHENTRFSEDLDFDNSGLKENDFENITQDISKKMQLEGFEVELRNVFKGAYHCYIRFPQMLMKLGLSGHGEERILIRLDTENQHYEFNPERKIINKFDVFTQIAITPPEILLAQKLYAVINRPRNKGRDFFDIVFLLGKNIKPDYGYLKQKLNISTASDLKDKISHKLKQLNMKEMADDVKPFLFNPTDEKKVLAFEKYFESVFI